MRISKRAKIIALLSLFVVAVMGAVGLYFNPMTPAVNSDMNIRIATGSSYTTLRDTLENRGVINNINKFDMVARLLSFENVRGGNYNLKEGDSYMRVVRQLRAGEQTPVIVTFNNIRSLEQLAGAVSKSLEADSAELVSLLKNDSIQKSMGLDSRTMLSMFIPDSYEFYWNTSAVSFISKMQSHYNSFWNESRLSKLKALNMSRTEVITLASIVYEESKITDEMPTIAGVYMNRLRIGMQLQADPTVKFALGDPTLRRILYVHLEVDSPYNTYKNRGLPPGPICMPSISAIESVLNYENHKYLYFCANADFSGRHAFATNLSQHNRNAAAYSAELNRRGIRR